MTRPSYRSYRLVQLSLGLRKSTTGGRNCAEHVMAPCRIGVGRRNALCACTATASALTGRFPTSEPGSNKQSALAGIRPRDVVAPRTVAASPETGTTCLVSGLVSRSTQFISLLRLIAQLSGTSAIA